MSSAEADAGEPLGPPEAKPGSGSAGGDDRGQPRIECCGSEKPRHVFREAGLVIICDLCPATLGSSTRLSTSLQIITSSWLGQSVIRLLETRLSKPCPRCMARAEDIVRLCHGSSARF